MTIERDNLKAVDETVVAGTEIVAAGVKHDSLLAQPDEIPVLHEAELQDMLEDPVIQERLERVHRMSKSRVKFMKRVAPDPWVIDGSLARRATMRVVEGPEADHGSESN